MDTVVRHAPERAWVDPGLVKLDIEIASVGVIKVPVWVMCEDLLVISCVMPCEMPEH